MDLLKKHMKVLEKEVIGSIKNVFKDSPQAFSSVPQQQQQQQQQYLAPAIFPSIQHPLQGSSHGIFNHPGTLIGPAELQLLKQRASGAIPVDPLWQAALTTLAASTPLSYSPHALIEVHIEWDNGPKIGHKEFVEQDGVMVYQQAVMWVVSGDMRYGSNAANIIDAWATTNKKFHGKNAPLNAGWGVASFARAAELLKHTSWPGWAESGVEGRFMSWVNSLIMPCLNHEMLHRLPLANWQTTIAECKAQLAILTDNKRLWDDALSWWFKVFDAYLKPCGECSETQRDLFHSQFGLGGLIQLAEMAWHQSVNLYSYQNSRLFTAMEFHAYITNGGKPVECCYPLKGVGFLPCGWEVGYNHYCGRMGWQMPQTARMLAANRPEKYVFHWGLGTLTHYGSAETLRSRQPQPT